MIGEIEQSKSAQRIAVPLFGIPVGKSYSSMRCRSLGSAEIIILEILGTYSGLTEPDIVDQLTESTIQFEEGVFTCRKPTPEKIAQRVKNNQLFTAPIT